MARYHVNDKGDAGVCRAQHGGCPFGSSEDHYDSAAEARQAYEASMTQSEALSHAITHPEFGTQLLASADELPVGAEFTVATADGAVPAQMRMVVFYQENTPGFVSEPQTSFARLQDAADYEVSANRSSDDGAGFWSAKAAVVGPPTDEMYVVTDASLDSRGAVRHDDVNPSAVFTTQALAEAHAAALTAQPEIDGDSLDDSFYSVLTPGSNYRGIGGTRIASSE